MTELLLFILYLKLNFLGSFLKEINVRIILFLLFLQKIGIMLFKLVLADYRFNIQYLINQLNYFTLSNLYTMHILMVPQAVNPWEMQVNELWQMDVTCVPEFGRYCYFHVSIDIFSTFIWGCTTYWSNCQSCNSAFK